MNEFEQNVIEIWGREGKNWLIRLPGLFEFLCKEWSLVVLGAFENLTYSFVSLVKFKGRRCVLKIAPLSERVSHEIEWYRMQQSVGCPKLLRYDKARGVLLLECVTPAFTAKSLVTEGKDDLATGAIADVILALDHRPCESRRVELLHVREFLKILSLLESKVPSVFINYAIKTLDQLTKNNPHNVVLHGDLHHDNILNDNGNWIAIDPHGYIGPRAFEVGAMMRNPYDCFPQDSLDTVLKSRVDLLESRLPFTRKEITDWSLICTLIASSWSLEDHAEVPREHLEICKALWVI